jgi:hypothetical protein
VRKLLLVLVDLGVVGVLGKLFLGGFPVLQGVFQEGSIQA